MFKTAIGLFIIFLLHGCTSTPSTTPGGDSSAVKMHTLSLDNNKKFTFKSSGCKLEEGVLTNAADFASAGSYGTLVVANSKSNTTVDQYRVSCSAVAAGGKSSCVIQRVQGTGTSKDFGGSNCPDMKFNLVNFRSF
jgi:hypothetical protein